MKTFRKIGMMLVVLFTAFSLASCGDDDDDKGPQSNSPFIGTWTKQVQWHGTDGTRDCSFTFKSDGTGYHKLWDVDYQKYFNWNFTWSTTSVSIVINIPGNQHPELGYEVCSREFIYEFNSGKTAVKFYWLDGDSDGWYYKE